MSSFARLRKRTESLVLPPGPQDTFNTLERKAPGRKRKSGRTEQFNARVAEGFGDRIRLLAERDNAKLGEILEAMWVALEATGGGRMAGVAPLKDRWKKRDFELRIWVKGELFQAAPRVAAARGLSLSELFEEWLAQEVNRLDPHGSGRFGVYVKREA